MIVCINKMDKTLPNPYSEARFNEIVNEAKNFLKKLGYKEENIQFIPISGYLGENLITRTDKMPWYKGVCLTEAIDKLPSPVRPSDKPLRLPL